MPKGIRKKLAQAVQFIDSGIKNIFNAAFDTRDPLTVSDDFAKAAFRREGYDVQKRESHSRFQDNYFYDRTEVQYLLKKRADNKAGAITDTAEYIGTVITGIVPASPEGAPGCRPCWIADIKPKV